MTVRLLFTCLYICISFVANAQVTVGSNSQPSKGALLDLKEKIPTDPSTDNTTGNLGLAMPRVKLTSITPQDNNLASTITGASLSPVWDTQEHIGLTVYHVDQCTFMGAGLYTWNGIEWQKLGSQTPGGAYLSTTTLDFPSGQDLRGISSQTVDVFWRPYSASITPPQWQLKTGNYAQANFNSPLPTGTLSNTTPGKASMIVEPAAMTTSDISANPFLTKDRLIEFTFAECNNQTATLNVTQTNKALQIKSKVMTSFNSLPPPLIYTGAASNEVMTVRSNAQWKVSANSLSTNSSATIGGFSPSSGTINGSELYNSTSVDVDQTYAINGGDVSRYSALVFEDTQNPARFQPITLTVGQCSGTSDPTMAQWRDLLVAANGGTLAQDTPGYNGIAWHQDQDGNIFLSLNFDKTNPKGNNNRWMLNNLAAKNYAPVPRTDGSTLPPAMTNAYTASLTAPNWSYPGGATASDATRYNARQRLGLLYTWAAATGSNTTSNGNEGGIDYPKRQGICPNGWYLPSDYDWTALENEITANTSFYSSTPDINTPPFTQGGGDAWRGTFQGQSIMDVCEPTTTFTPTSNLLLYGGFSLLFTGYANESSSQVPDTYTYLWTSSSNGTSSAWARRFNVAERRIHRYGSPLRNYAYPIRCKKY